MMTTGALNPSYGLQVIYQTVAYMLLHVKDRIRRGLNTGLPECAHLTGQIRRTHPADDSKGT